jgi:hypothetical protein
VARFIELDSWTDFRPNFSKLPCDANVACRIATPIHLPLYPSWPWIGDLCRDSLDPSEGDAPVGFWGKSSPNLISNGPINLTWHATEDQDGPGEALTAFSGAMDAQACRNWRPRGQAQEHDQIQSKSQGGARVPHPEARLRIYQSALPGVEEEPPVAVRSLRAGELIPAPQTVGPAGGVVSLDAGKRPPETPKSSPNNLHQGKSCSKIASKPPQRSGTTKSGTCAEVP